ncbi:hypothetical protein I4U23_016626 [Adineta vaga]|nr:hypothetical protein I4U23_016626 [Adineta vaga]
MLGLMLLFSTCRIHHTSIPAEDKRLFYCDRSMKFISKHRVMDTHFDCLYEEDEVSTLNTTVINSLNLTYHFKCAETDQWLPRPLVTSGFCQDNSDRLYIGSCKTAFDIGCQFLRGLGSHPVDYLFQENCNGVLKLTFSKENETDETSCNEWPWPMYRRCDGHWDTSDGEDELNCSNTILSHITHTILKCSMTEHYCAHRNKAIGCLAKERAGDGIVDCLGKTDERVISCALSYPLHSFTCSNGDCVRLANLCDGHNDCPNGDDELVCSWIVFNVCKPSEFQCESFCIPRARQCDGFIDCPSNGEDEWFCDLGYRRIPQFSLDTVEKYPPVSDAPRLMTATVSHQLISIPLIISTKSRNINLLNRWFCNQGIIVTKRSLNVECLCPPSYYGPRCQYQAERLLITIRIDTPASLSRHKNQQNVIRLVACLLLDNTVAHHEQILHETLMKQMFYLNYPRPPPKQRGNWSVRIDAFSVTKFNVAFHASWLFDVPFSFLPVNRLVLHVTLKDHKACNTLICVHGSCKRYLNSPYREYCQCEENYSGDRCNVTARCACAYGGKCANQHSTLICVCPLGRTGSECRVSFDPCSHIDCQHGGTCLPLDERQSTKLFICSCRTGYYGSRCEHADAKIQIHFSKSLFHHNLPLSVAVFVHFLVLQNNSPGILFVQNRFLYQKVQLNKPLNVFNKNQKYLSSFILLQIFFEPDNYGYYIAGIIKSNMTTIVTTVHEWNRCLHVDKLLLNATIRSFPSRKKVKYYGRACEVSSSIRWFHDEAYLCFCNKDRIPDCLYFQEEDTQCTTNYCQNNGRCVQNNFDGIWDFGCVCDGCTYGSLCQLTTSQYTLSLDAMLGQDILENASLTNQPVLIKLVLAVIVLMLSLGFLSNILAFITFKQPKVQEFGCGMYLLCLPLIGQLGLSIFASRFFYLLVTQIYNVNNRFAVHWGCVVLEYLLSVCPMLFDWLTACVAVERSVNIIKGASFRKGDSVWWAKRIILVLVVVVLSSAWHEPFIRHLIDDPRATVQHTCGYGVFITQINTNETDISS